MKNNIIPEIIAVVVMVFTVRESVNLPLLCLVFLIHILLIRLTWNSAILLHGLGHVIASIASDQKSTIRIIDICEHRSIKDILKSLLPGSAIFIPGLKQEQNPWLAVGDMTPWKIRLKAIGGISLNMLAVALAWLAFNCGYLLNDPAIFFWQTFAVANLLIALSSWTDLGALLTGVAHNFYCGNFGFICQRLASDENQLLPERMVNMYYQMGRETEIRGEQAGGGLVVAKDQDDQIVFVGEKVVNRKRDNLTDSLESTFASVRRKSERNDISPLEMSTMGVWHYRFGTSGPPAIIETHWHEWMSAREENVWQFTEGQWINHNKNVNNRITHNGDFDACTLYGEEVENRELGLWLERVLYTPNHTKGDSPKIAGMMDFLITQGMWYASVRLAYHLTIVDSIESAFGGQQPHRDAPNTVPDELLLINWAKAFENTFMLYRRLLAAPNSPACNQYLCRLEHDVLQALAQDDTVSQWAWPKRVNFVRTTIDAFFRNDIYFATKTFMLKAHGSFGLVTVSTLDKEQLVLSAQGQPMSIGFNWQDGYMIYASEPAAVDAVLLNLPESYRLDLDQKKGEIALVSANEITIYSMSQNQELHPSELRERWISMESHPYLPHVKYPANSTEDPIASDNQEIPAILEEIKLTWQNPSSLNCQTADYLVQLLYEKARAFENQRQKMLRAGLSKLSRQLPTVDLLIIGVENSLWLGEKFAQDLTMIMPWLNVKSWSANQVVQNLKNDFGSLQLSKESIILAITQSGQTFPTIQAINTFDQLYRQGEIRELFVLTGELGSFLGSPVIKPREKESKICERHKIFVNGSGRRTAEPATVAVAAAQQTFTELLIYLAKNMRQTFPNSMPFGMTLTEESITTLEKMRDDFLDIGVVQIMGNSPTGKKIDSATRKQLIDSGRKWAWHITETPTAWAIHALYVLITVGWAIPFGYTIPLAKTVLGLFVWILHIPADLFVFKLINPVITLVDIGIYIFGSWLWTLGLRYFQGRQLLARIGKRTLVIGDVPWVHQLLKNYVSKLFSLSYGIASIEVHGANPEDELLHEYGHRVVRGTLLFLGVPDGRKSQKLKQRENSVILAGKQADGVRNIDVGPEVVVMGSNPDIANKGFTNALILESSDDCFYFPNDTVYFADKNTEEQKALVEELRESRFSSFERLLASYVFFWALAQKVASFPFLRYQHWKSQSRTKIMTTAAPVAGISTPNWMVDKNEQKEPLSDDPIVFIGVTNRDDEEIFKGSEREK
ncbi:MAG: hypothetical protein ACRC80_35595 [Waterburya sp.]